jgi:DNA-binding winged helix-turn-helix (wHTH) protein/Tol biopolymer transport system component
MSLEVSHLYEFDEFRLDPAERILTRAGEPVELTPKGFELLKVLVENHGRLLGKDELMNKIWADSFVEEGNLTFNIRQLRVVLEDDAHNPKFIKTIRRHGYRFIAEVRQIPAATVNGEKTETKPQTTAPFVSQPPGNAAAENNASKPKPKFSAPIFAFGFLLVAAAGFGAWYLKSKVFQTKATVIEAPSASEKLSTNGKVGLAAISPDGKNVVYTNGTEKQSVWLRQLESGDNNEIIPEIDQVYLDFAFAPNGDSLYFSRRMNYVYAASGIYRKPLFGGVPQKIISNTITPIGISPDGSQLAFVRYPHAEEFCTVHVADAATGANERKIAVLPEPFYIRDLDFSADGKNVVFASGQYKNATNEVDLTEVDLTTGTQRMLTNEKFSDISKIARMPDGDSWLFTGSKIPVLQYRIWKANVNGSAPVQLTQGAEFFDAISLDQRAAAMIVMQTRFDYHIRFFSLGNETAENPTRLDGETVSIAPDGKIYFNSWMSGTSEIWSANSDGSNLRQLTNNKWEEDSPIVSPDNNTIYFSSVQTGKWFLWRMNTDGSNLQQVSFKTGGSPIVVTSDGEWLYFIEHDKQELWRISLKTGEEQAVIAKYSYFGFAVLPDGSKAAYPKKLENQWFINVASLPDGKMLKSFSLSEKSLTAPLLVAWTKDAKSLLYSAKNTETGNFTLWLQPLDGGAARQIANLENENLVGFSMPLTPDGKFVAVSQGSIRHDAVLMKGLR